MFVMHLMEIPSFLTIKENTTLLCVQARGHVAIRGQLTGALLSSHHVAVKDNSARQDWWSVSLPAEPSGRPDFCTVQ